MVPASWLLYCFTYSAREKFISVKGDDDDDDDDDDADDESDNHCSEFSI